MYVHMQGFKVNEFVRLLKGLKIQAKKDICFLGDCIFFPIVLKLLGFFFYNYLKHIYCIFVLLNYQWFIDFMCKMGATVLKNSFSYFFLLSFYRI